jgi:hypothetical protein
MPKSIYIKEVWGSMKSKKKGGIEPHIEYQFVTQKLLSTSENKTLNLKGERSEGG